MSHRETCGVCHADTHTHENCPKLTAATVHEPPEPGEAAKGGTDLGALLKKWRPDSRFRVQFEWDLGPDRSTKYMSATAGTLQEALRDLCEEQGLVPTRSARAEARSGGPWFVVEDDGSYNTVETEAEARELLACASEDAFITREKPRELGEGLTAEHFAAVTNIDEARSDGEGERCGECGATDGRCATHGHLNKFQQKAAQPPQPGGHGPTEALRAEIVEALRDVHTALDEVGGGPGAYALRKLADRLERKP